MQKNRLYILLYVVFGIIILPNMMVACADSDFSSQQTSSDGQMQVISHFDGILTNSRAAYVHGDWYFQKYFVENSEIGISVANEDYSAFLGGTNNRRWVADGKRTDSYNHQLWYPVGGEAANGVSLTESNTLACAYYPWRSGVTDFTNIHWRVDPHVDVMYAPWTKSTSVDISNPPARLPLTKNSPIVDFTFKHAQAIIAVVVRNEGYNDRSLIHKVKIHGPGFGEEADLDAGTGTLNNVTDTLIEEDYDPPLTFKIDSVKDHFYCFPTGVKKRIYFDFLIDSRMQSSHADIALQQGVVYEFRFKMSSVRLEFDSVSIKPWESAGIETVEARPYVYDMDKYDYVDIGAQDEYGNKILWATTNIGAEDTLDVGHYWMWGKTTPWAVDDKIGPTYYVNQKDISYNSIARTQYDAARVNWGNENRMPTRYEWDYLSNTTLFRWVDTTITANGKTVRGMYVRNRADPSKHLFFPHTGYRTYVAQGLFPGMRTDTVDILSSDAGVTGYYWTATQGTNLIPYQPIYQKMGTGAPSGHITVRAEHKDSLGMVIRPVKVYRQYDKEPFK